MEVLHRCATVVLAHCQVFFIFCETRKRETTGTRAGTGRDQEKRGAHKIYHGQKGPDKLETPKTVKECEQQHRVPWPGTVEQTTDTSTRDNEEGSERRGKQQQSSSVQSQYHQRDQTHATRRDGHAHKGAHPPCPLRSNRQSDDADALMST